MVDLFLAPLSFFAFNPAAAFAVAALFGVPTAFRRFQGHYKRTLLGVAGVWFAFGVWESLMARNAVPGQPSGARLDHFMVAPLIIGATMVGAAVIYRALKGEPPRP